MAIDATRTDIVTCSNALTLLGEKTISNFTASGNQPRGGICERLYPTFKKSILAKHPWKFAMKKLQLSKDATPPITAWTNQFLFPGDRVHNGFYRLFDTASVGTPPFRNFEIFGERIMTEASALWIDYVHNAVESLWPEDFSEFIEVAFAARIALPINGSRKKRSDLMIEAYGNIDREDNGGLWQQVKTNNLIGSPVMTYGDDTLAQARFGGLNPTPTGGENYIF